MEDRFRRLRREMEESLLRGPAASDASLRQAAFALGELPAELGALVKKIHDHAYKVTDEEVAALRARYSDDQLYEIMVCAATGAAAVRFEAGLRALDAAEQEGGARAVAKG